MALAAGFARGEKWQVCEHQETLVACTALKEKPVVPVTRPFAIGMLP